MEDIRESKDINEILTAIVEAYKTQKGEIYPPLSGVGYCEAMLDIMKYIASQSESILELGTGIGISTIAFIAGKPKSIVTTDTDIGTAPYFNIDELATVNRVTLTRLHENALHIETGDIDTLYIDDLHDPAHISKELDRYTSKVRKYIVFHDTIYVNTIGTLVEEFLKSNPEWSMAYNVKEGFGMMVVKRG